MKALTKEELDGYRKRNEPIWAVATCVKDEPSGWALAGTRAAIMQDFTTVVLWYETYGLEWVAYSEKI